MSLRINGTKRLFIFKFATAGYTLDIVFSKPTSLRFLDIPEELVPCDSHHRSAFFRLLYKQRIVSQHKPRQRNFVLGNYQDINRSHAEYEWERLFTDLDIDAVSFLLFSIFFN